MNPIKSISITFEDGTVQTFVEEKPVVDEPVDETVTESTPEVVEPEVITESNS